MSCRCENILSSRSLSIGFLFIVSYYSYSRSAFGKPSYISQGSRAQFAYQRGVSIFCLSAMCMSSCALLLLPYVFCCPSIFLQHLFFAVESVYSIFTQTQDTHMHLNQCNIHDARGNLHTNAQSSTHTRCKHTHTYTHKHTHTCSHILSVSFSCT